MRQARADAQTAQVDSELDRFRRSVAAKQAALTSIAGEIDGLDLQIREAVTERLRRSGQLSRELSTVAALEQDLEAARAREAGIQAALQAVRDLESQLQRRDQRIQELTGQIAAKAEVIRKLEEQVAASEAAAALAQATLEARLGRLVELAAQVQVALDASSVLAPATPPEKPAEPVKEPAAGSGKE